MEKNKMSNRLGKILINDKILTQKQLQEAMEMQQKDNIFLGRVLVKLGYFNEGGLTEYLKRHWYNLI